MLLLDAGNTRIKWCVRRGDDWVAEGAFPTAEASTLARIVEAHPGIRHALGVNVAGDAVGARLASILEPVAPHWVRSSARACGVTNLYEHPEQLGADRWAALIGAHALHRGACLVVTAGTAITIDLLDTDGSFLGGLIMPGDKLMRRALAGNTAQLPFADGHFLEQPRNTLDAIVSGCLHAQLGAIERMFAQIANRHNAICLINGGDADRIAPALGIPRRQIDNLVLKGLGVLADAMWTCAP